MTPWSVLGKHRLCWWEASLVCTWGPSAGNVTGLDQTGEGLPWRRPDLGGGAQRGRSSPVQAGGGAPYPDTKGGEATHDPG